MDDPPSRRRFLQLAGLTGLSASAAACTSGPAPLPPPPPTAAQLLARDRFFIAHRGAGDEAPEHTLGAYRHALDRGAEAIEISVHRTRDGVLVCNHDPTLERTCNGFPGAIKDLTTAELAAARVDLRWYVGPGWTPEPVPRLDAALDLIGSRAVVFVEPKDPAAAGDVLATIQRHGLTTTAVYKQHYTAQGDDAARRAGLAVWNYLDSSATPADVPALVGRSDVLGVQADAEPLSDAQARLVTAATRTGVPVIAWALHRRYQADALAAMGVRGFMCSSWSYLAQPQHHAPADGFASRRVQPGDLTTDYARESAPVWNDDGSLGLASAYTQHSLSMGSLCPVGPAPYRITLDLRFDGGLADPAGHAGLVIGRARDTAYTVDDPGSDGLLAVLRADGGLELRPVPDGDDPGGAASAPGAAVAAGRWESIAVDVDATGVTLRRTTPGVTADVVRAPTPPTGGYFALLRSTPDRTAVRFRSVRVSTP